MSNTKRYCLIAFFVALTIGSVIGLCNNGNETSDSGFDIVTFVVLFL